MITEVESATRPRLDRSRKEPVVQSSVDVWGRQPMTEEGVMTRDEEGGVLQKDRPNSTYELLLRKAVEEGRIGGDFRCQVCGMRYKSPREASTCCEKVLQHSRLS